MLISLRGAGWEGVLISCCLRKAAKFNGPLRYIRWTETPTCGGCWACQKCRTGRLSPPGGAGLGAEAAGGVAIRRIRRRTDLRGPVTTRPAHLRLRPCPRAPSSGGPRRGPAHAPPLWPTPSGTRRAARHHGAQAARRPRTRGAGASRARLVRRRPNGLGFLFERGRGGGRGRAPRSGCGGRAAGGRVRGEDGRPHPEAVLPHPGEAPHQPHPAGPGEVMRRRTRPVPGPASRSVPCRHRPARATPAPLPLSAGAVSRRPLSRTPAPPFSAAFPRWAALAL